MASTGVPRPFLKWAGGKTRLLPELLARAPEHFGRYYEPFLGGGALFFALCRAGRVQSALLSDANRELIDTYIAIRDDLRAVIEYLEAYKQQHSADFYYALRARDPSELSPSERAARMIYLNKTGYNGLYRVNRQGKFNVPFGRYKSPSIYDEANLQAISAALQGVELRCRPFEEAVATAQAGDWVYCDPPYAPSSKTANFTAYQAGGFSSDDQRRLRDLCAELAGRDVYVMVSNSATPLIRDLYGGEPFHLHEVHTRRAINSKRDGRGLVKELIITGYAPSGALPAQRTQRASGSRRVNQPPSATKTVTSVNNAQ